MEITESINKLYYNTLHGKIDWKIEHNRLFGTTIFSYKNIKIKRDVRNCFQITTYGFLKFNESIFYVDKLDENYKYVYGLYEQVLASETHPMTVGSDIFYYEKSKFVKSVNKILGKK